jgi:hypothetical protein
MPDKPAFGPRVAARLREWKRANPTTSADQFYAKLEEVANDELKMLSLLERPRFSKREAQSVLFEALAEACGLVPVEMTKPEQRVCAVASAEIRQASPDVTPFEIKRRARLYRTRHRDWPLTPKALCLHWSSLGEGDRTLTAKRDVYTEPVGWREVAARLFPGADFSDREWADIRVTFGAQILGAMQ